MAKVNRINVCRLCGSEAPPEATQCGSCQYVFGVEDTENLSAPEYVNTQIRDQRTQIEGIPSQEDQVKELVALRGELEEWFLNCPDISRVDALNDARDHLRYALLANRSRGALNEMIITGKHIGQLAQKIDDYLKTGGHIHEYKTREAESGDREESSSDPS